MSRVLVAVDGSVHSEDAFKWYLKTLHRPETKVILLTCPELYLYGEHSRHAVQTVNENIAQETSALKTKIMTLADASSVDSEWIERPTTKPGQAIVDISGEQAVDFIVTGTRGQGTLTRTIFGSVSSYVVHHAPCPVLVYRK